MNSSLFLKLCGDAGIDLFTGVPDSQLKGLCDTLFAMYGTNGRHIVAANEGNAIGIAAGHYLATGRPALVYMQNSGIGNAVNPLASLMDAKVYAMPCLLVIGWRGEPGVKDEPQHVTQGEITLRQLDILSIPYFVLSKDTTDQEFTQSFDEITRAMREGKTCAIVVRKGALKADAAVSYPTRPGMTRERACELLTEAMAPDDIVVSTTGKLSRELFEIREHRKEGHARDFLTVGSMGHASSIALGIALEKPDRRVWCLDGDGAALMHLGSMAVIGQRKPGNLIHVVINNGAHETVGGMPVCETAFSPAKPAASLGYEKIIRCETEESVLDAAKDAMTGHALTLIEITCSLGCRDDLGRPTTTPVQNRDAFMAHIAGGENK